MQDVRKIFAANIKRLRKSRHLTQEQFAELIDMQWKSVTNMELGRSIPNSKNLQIICEKMNVSPAELFLVPNKTDKLKEKISEIQAMLDKMDEKALNIAYGLIKVLSENT